MLSHTWARLKSIQAASTAAGAARTASLAWHWGELKYFLRVFEWATHRASASSSAVDEKPEEYGFKIKFLLDILFISQVTEAAVSFETGAFSRKKIT